jgi:hypothetical protein
MVDIPSLTNESLIDDVSLSESTTIMGGITL